MQFLFWQMFGWSDYYLKVYLLLGCPFLVSLTEESKVSFRFFLSALLSVPGLLTFQLETWDIWAQKKTQGTHDCHSSSPMVPGQSDFFSPPFRVFLKIFLVCIYMVFSYT